MRAHIYQIHPCVSSLPIILLYSHVVACTARCNKTSRCSQSAASACLEIFAALATRVAFIYSVRFATKANPNTYTTDTKQNFHRRTNTIQPFMTIHDSLACDISPTSRPFVVPPIFCAWKASDLLRSHHKKSASDHHDMRIPLAQRNRPKTTNNGFRGEHETQALATNLALQLANCKQLMFQDIATQGPQP